MALTQLVLVATAFAEGKFDLGGYASFDLRYFLEEPLHAGQKRQLLNPSLAIRPELSYEWNRGNDRINFAPFVRLDANDRERSHGDIRELYYFHAGDGWDIRVGADKVFWGVAESRHLVDIINQTDAVEDVDGEDKLGQPMVNLGIQQDWGDVNLFFMPYFRERTFPGRSGRLRAGLVVDQDRAQYESDNKKYNPDVALRYSRVFGDWDVGLAHFYGTSREPRFGVGFDGPGNPVLIPIYDIISQTSLDVQATIEEWLLKAEVIYRTGHGRDFTATVIGFEYTFFGVVGASGDLGILAEYHYDARDDSAPLTLFDDDLFLGARITLNDANNTDFLAGILIDRETQSWSLSMKADRRLTDNFTFEAELRLSGNATAKDPIYPARRDNHLLMKLIYYF